MPLKNEISYEKIVSLIDEAKKLGAKSVIVIGGGEPTIYPKFKKLIQYIANKNLVPVIFTNTQTMTVELAKFLFKHNVSVITKIDSLDEKIQDELVGSSGALKRIMRGIYNLQKVGYAEKAMKGKLKLGASCVVNKKNINQVEKIWRFCRERNIFPNIEMMVPNGRGKDDQNLILSREEWRVLKTSLLKIDEKEYGYTWLPYTPLISAGCFQVMYNLYITVRGVVRPCSSIHYDKINISDYSLSEIIKLPFFQKARNIEKYLRGKCHKCEYHSECIGCRGLAFSCAVNEGENPEMALCSEDPACFKK